MFRPLIGVVAGFSTLILVSIEPAWAAAWPDRVGTAEVIPGQVTRGRLPLIEYADGTDVEAPVIVVAGRTRGPVAWLISCGHGDEVGGADHLPGCAERRQGQGERGGKDERP